MKMKSKEIQEDIEELQEKADLAEHLEQLHEWATQGREIIYDVLGKMSDLEELGFRWNGTLESIINTIIKDVESKLKAL